MKLSFIIPTLNRSFELNRLLGSFVIQTRKPDEIIIIDQGGIQNGEMVKEYNLPIKYLPVNFRSLTRARNLGIRECSGDIVCFLDDDIVLAIDYVEKIANFLPQILQREVCRG